MVLDQIFEPFQYSFMIRALIVCVLVGIMCPFLGAHVINREMGFMGDALAHSVLPGMVAAYAIGFNPLIGAIPMGIIVSLCIGYLVKKSKVSNDTSIGIMYAGLLALGLVMLSINEGIAVNVEDVFLGQVLSTSWMDVYITLILAVLVLLIMLLFYKQMIFVGFDYEGAVVAGIPAAKLDYLLLVILSIVIVVTLHVVGIVLVIGMLITPAAASSLIVKRFSGIILIGILFGIIASIMGWYISYHFNIPSGPAICLASTAIFILAFVKTKVFK